MPFVQPLLQNTDGKRTTKLNYLIYYVIDLNTSLKSKERDFDDFSKTQFVMFSSPAIGFVILLFVSKSFLRMFSFGDKLIISLLKKKKLCTNVSK